MGFSVLIAVGGICARAEVLRDEPGDFRAAAPSGSPGAHALLSNKYYVDELYNATVIAGTFGAGRGLWAVDRNVVDGAVNGSGLADDDRPWFSGLTDRTVVDGAGEPRRLDRAGSRATGSAACRPAWCRTTRC